jgi:hypothetical protein
MFVLLLKPNRVIIAKGLFLFVSAGFEILAKILQEKGVGSSFHFFD